MTRSLWPSATRSSKSPESLPAQQRAKSCPRPCWSSTTGPSRTCSSTWWARGYGDTELGVKYRFIQETDTLPQIGIFPMVELPTGNADRGLGSGHTAVYVPLWLQKSFGKWTTYGGYGWWRNPGEGQRNWSYTGWLLQREVAESLTLGGEVFRTTASTQDGSNAVGWNLGAVINLNEHHHILVSAGRNFSGPSETHAYLGYQFTFTAGSRALTTAEHPLR